MDHSSNSMANSIPDWRDFSTITTPPALDAALDCFVTSGYHGATVRSIASQAGLSVPGFYHHYPSKQATLVELMNVAMNELYARSILADKSAGIGFSARLSAHIECLVLFHANRSRLAFIAASEIRALEPGHRETYIDARDRQQQLLEAIVSEGVSEGKVQVMNVRVATRALITMCTAVAQWYRPGGSLSPTQLANQYIELGKRMLGLTGTS